MVKDVVDRLSGLESNVQPLLQEVRHAVETAQLWPELLQHGPTKRAQSPHSSFRREHQYRRDDGLDDGPSQSESELLLEVTPPGSPQGRGGGVEPFGLPPIADSPHHKDGAASASPRPASQGEAARHTHPQRGVTPPPRQSSPALSRRTETPRHEGDVPTTTTGVVLPAPASFRWLESRSAREASLAAQTTDLRYWHFLRGRLASDDGGDVDGLGSLLSITPEDERVAFGSAMFSRSEFMQGRSPLKHRHGSGSSGGSGSSTGPGLAGTPHRINVAGAAWSPMHARGQANSGGAGQEGLSPPVERSDGEAEQPDSPVVVAWGEESDAIQVLDDDDVDMSSSDSDDGDVTGAVGTNDTIAGLQQRILLRPSDPLEVQSLLTTAKRFVARLQRTVDAVGRDLQGFDDRPSVRGMSSLVSALFRAKVSAPSWCRECSIVLPLVFMCFPPFLAVCDLICVCGGRVGMMAQLLLPSTQMAVDAAEEAFRSFSDKWFDLQQRQSLVRAYHTLEGHAVELTRLRGRLVRLGE